jgi:type VI protein secretion system component VasK
MTDDTNTLHEAILSGLLIDAWKRVRDDPTVDPFRRLDALGARMSEVQEAASALRMLADDLAISTAPEAVRSRAAANDTATKAAEARRMAWTRTLEIRGEKREAEEVVGKARDGLQRARTELDRLTKGEGSDHQIVMAEGAIAAYEDKIAKAEANLAAVIAKAEATR